MEMSEALLALDEACLKNDPVELFWFLRLMKEEKEDMLPGLRKRSNREARSVRETLSASPKVERVGESVEWIEGAFCRSLESKNGRDSSKESDLGRGIVPLTVVASNPYATRRDMRKSMASFKPPALLRV